MIKVETIPVPFDLKLSSGTLLQAGALSCVYEQGIIRQVKIGEAEVAKMIYGAVRDPGWEAPPCHIGGEKIVNKGNSFVISYKASYASGLLGYEALFRIEGREDGSLVFSMRGRAPEDIYVNRIGLCLHLPVSGFRGREADIMQDDGLRHTAVFPRMISPQQVFTGVRKISWEMDRGVKAEWLFEGDVFEIEDQRNWMDDSYKVYSRPLSLPFPFEVKQGERMEQRISLKPPAAGLKKPPAGPEAPSLEPEMPLVNGGETPVKVPVPKIGYVVSDDRTPLPAGEVSMLRQVPFEHGLVELAFDAHWRQSLARAIEQVGELNTKLSLAVSFSKDYRQEVDALLPELRPQAERLKSILLLQQGEKVTPVPLLTYAYPRIKAVLPAVQVGYGTDAYFAELNRNRPPRHPFDFVSFSMNPQVHVFDTRSIAGNLTSIPDIIATTRSFTGKPVHVSPVTFKKRKNHDSTEASELPPTDPFDDRQCTWFGAAWFLQCLYYLNQAEQISFFEATGEKGLTGSAAGKPSPLYQVLAALKKFYPVLMWQEETPKGISIVFENKEGEVLKFNLDQQFSLLMQA